MIAEIFRFAGLYVEISIELCAFHDRLPHV